MSVLDFPSQFHRYSIDEYEQLVELGAFEDQPVELLDGLIFDMSPKSVRHENAVRWLHHTWLLRSLDVARDHILIGGPLLIGGSEPEPDLAIVGSQLGTSHPTKSSLVIEVANSSHERDLRLKPRLYAPAVAEYWVLDLSQDHFVVHRGPGDDGYRQITVLGRGAELLPQHVAVDPLDISRLLDAI
jgi:Uma2 family endonuclease